MRDLKLTELMLKSLQENPKLASADEWHKAGDFAMDMRFFPHAFNCYRLSMELEQNQEVIEKLDTVLDKITNVLEHVPAVIKDSVEEIRLNNPLDPARWLQFSNTLLKEEEQNEEAIKFSLAMTIYCALRSGVDVDPMNQTLVHFMDLPAVDERLLQNKVKLDNVEKVVAFGDNVTLGLQKNWEVNLEDVYHSLWQKELSFSQKISVANCGVSGAGILDGVLYLGRDVMNYKPDLVLLNFGINDAWLGPQVLLAYEALLEFTVNYLKLQGIQVAIIGPVPHIPSACSEEQRPSNINIEEIEIQGWNNVCMRVAQKTQVPFANIVAKFPVLDQDRAKLFANDFNQPNLEGNKLIKDALLEICEGV